MSFVSHIHAAHLTNYSINKSAPNYAENKDTIGGGAKWTLSRLLKCGRSAALLVVVVVFLLFDVA